MNAAARDSAPEPFDWEGAMAFGLGVLRLPSSQFWNMTLIELAAAWRGLCGVPAPALARADLAALMQEFPDD